MCGLVGGMEKHRPVLNALSARNPFDDPVDSSSLIYSVFILSTVLPIPEFYK